MNDPLKEAYRELGVFDDTPENRLAGKITMLWLEAMQFNDFKWMKAYLKEMERLRDVQPNLERLQRLYNWSKIHLIEHEKRNQ